MAIKWQSSRRLVALAIERHNIGSLVVKGGLVEGLRPEWHRIDPKVPRIGNENFPSGFCLPLEIQVSSGRGMGLHWHSGRALTGCHSTQCPYFGPILRHSGIASLI